MGVPAQLGRYHIESELGTGSMGRVYLAHDPAIDRKVAIKTVILPEGLSQVERDEIHERFQREVRAAGRLAHPNIVTIFDLGDDATAGVFVAMEYIEGRELGDYTTAATLLPPRTVASIGCQAADALAYAHREGIVHRDIKPQNLILVGEKNVKIADFGLAKQIGASLTTTGSLRGTPYYMSPEQIRGIDVDGRSDLFSLAVVIYELLTGKRPFRGESISTVIYRITSEPPIAPDLTRLADSAEHMKRFLGRALAKNPDDRFQTGDEFARALREAFTAGQSTEESASASRAAASPQQRASASGGVTQAVGGGPAAPGADTPEPRRTERAGTRRRRGTRSRTKRPVSLMPLLALLAIAAGAGFVYREELWDLVEGHDNRPGVLPVENGQPGAGVTAPDGSGGPPGRDGSKPPPAPGDAPGSIDSPSASGRRPAADDPAVGKAPAGSAGDAGADGGGGAAAPAGATTAAGDKTPPVGSGSVPGKSLPPSAPVPTPPPVDTLVGLQSSPAGATFFFGDRRLPGNRVPAPDAGDRLTIRAVLDCREATRDIGSGDAGGQVVFDLQPAEVAVRIVSDPAGAAVKVDGKRRGKTPASVTLDACQEHTVVLDRDGYKQWKRNLRLADGRLNAPATLTAELVPLPTGTLVIPQPPYPVTIKLGGRQVVKPGRRMTVVAGNYRVEFSSEALMFRREVRVRVTKEGTVTPDIEFPPVVELSVVAQPGNADIEISNDAYRRDLGAPPIFGEKIVAGTYRLKCRFNHTGEEQEKTIHLAAGDSSHVRFVAGRP